jgi:hypothetical protein
MVFLIVCMQIPGYDLKSHHDRFLSYAFQFVLWGTDSRSHEPQTRTALFLAITQRVVVISYRSFGTTYQSYIQGPDSPRRRLKMGLTFCHETSLGHSFKAV